MKNKIVVMIGFVFFFVSVSSFAQEKKESEIRVSAHERDKEKAAFDHSKVVYDSKKNKAIRAKKKAVKKIKREENQEKKIVEEQDKNKGQIQVKF